MKKIVMSLFLISPILSNAQEEPGVNFSKGLTWKQVIEKAKTEKKNIFIDAYATWCSPCKKMDIEVYSNDSVGNYVNANFIAVKVQIDKNASDFQEVKNWYRDASRLQQQYEISELPTFIFISPDGNLIHRGSGYLDTDKFMTLLRNANDPKLNYAGRVQQYMQGKLQGQQLVSLSLMAKQYKDDSLSIKIAEKYKSSFLDNKNPSTILSHDLRDFMSNFYELFTVNDKVINYMYKYPVEADLELGQKGFSRTMTDYVITKDLINPALNTDTNSINSRPDWTKLEKRIRELYDETTAKRLLINSKLYWYNTKKDWPNIVKYNIEKLEEEGIDTVGLAKSSLNNMIYEVIFQHSDDTLALKKGIKYIELLLKDNATHHTWIDTYANLLYKLGRKEEAFRLEQKALNIAEKTKNFEHAKEYKETLRKMRNEEPTWE